MKWYSDSNNSFYITLLVISIIVVAILSGCGQPSAEPNVKYPSVNQNTPVPQKQDVVIDRYDYIYGGYATYDVIRVTDTKNNIVCYFHHDSENRELTCFPIPNKEE